MPKANAPPLILGAVLKGDNTPYIYLDFFTQSNRIAIEFIIIFWVDNIFFSSNEWLP